MCIWVYKKYRVIYFRQEGINTINSIVLLKLFDWKINILHSFAIDFFQDFLLIIIILQF